MELSRIRIIYQGEESIFAKLQLPDGMELFDLTFMRSEKYHSMVNSFALPIGFINESRELVERINDNDGVDAIAEIFYDRRQGENLAWKNFAKGFLNFHKWKQKDLVTEIPMNDGSKLARMIERDGIEYNVKSNVSTDGVVMPDIPNAFKLMTYSSITPTAWADFLVGVSSIYGGLHGLPIIETEYTGYGHSGTVKNFLNSSINANPIITTEPVLADVTGDFIYKNISDVSKTLRVQFDIDLTLTTTFGGSAASGLANLKYGYIIRHYDAADNPLSDVAIYSDDTVVGQVLNTFTKSESFDGTYTIDVDEYIVVFGYIYYAQITQQFIGFPVFTVNNVFDNYRLIELGDTIPASDNSSILPDELFSKFIQLATSELDTSKLLYSEELGRTDSPFQTYSQDGRMSLIAVTDGNNLRGFDRAMNTSFEKAFKSFDSKGNLGFWFNRELDRFEIKKKEFFFRDDIIIDLGEVSKLESTVFNNRYANTINGGCATDNDYDTINGITEPNGKTSYSTPVEEKNPLDIRSPYTNDTIGITATRAKQFIIDETTIDNSLDNNIFMVQMKRSGESFITETGFDFNAIIGTVNGEQLYNWRWTGKRSMLNYSNVISPNFWKKKEGSINAVSTRNDIDAKTQILATDPIISELANESAFNTIEVIGGIPIPKLTNVLPPLYDNVLYTIWSPITDAHIQQMYTDPHGAWTCTFRGVRYYGKPWEVSTRVHKKKGNIKLVKMHVVT